MTPCGTVSLVFPRSALAPLFIFPLTSPLPFPSIPQCGGFITSAITLASVLTAAAALLAVQMSLGVEVCCRHPGDADRWEGDTVEARGLSIRKIPAPIEGNGKAPLQSVSINYV